MKNMNTLGKPTVKLIGEDGNALVTFKSVRI